MYRLCKSGKTIPDIVAQWDKGLASTSFTMLSKHAGDKHCMYRNTNNKDNSSENSDNKKDIAKNCL